MSGWYVILSIGYSDREFKFDNIEDAGRFAETMLESYCEEKPNDDNFVTIKPVSNKFKEDE